MKFYIRKATAKDLPEILEIISQGQAFLKIQGLSQWQGNSAIKVGAIEKDIDDGAGYVFCYGEKIGGYTSLVHGIDPVYTAITEGQWEADGAHPYVSVHRVSLASSIRGKGLGKIFLAMMVDKAKELSYTDIRIDTHPENVIMQKVIASVGFIYRGVVEFPFFDGKRKAYQILTK